MADCCRIRILIITLVCILISSSLSAPDPRGMERAALLQFGSSVSDPAGILSSWSRSAGDYCSWRFVSCNSRSRVVSLNIIVECSKLGVFDPVCRNPVGRLSGELNSVIGSLSELRILSLPSHRFSGEIPADIWRLGKLELLDLSENLLNGSLPSYFPPNLRVLKLAANSIEGAIPVSLSNSTALEILDLSRNNFNGSVPLFLANLSKLKEIKLGFNLLKNSIPEEIGSNCMNLEYLDLSGNRLIGNIPSNLGNCIEIRVLLLFSNSLEGSIPSQIVDKCESLTVLNLSKNKISGQIPQNIRKLKNLKFLSLAQNNFTGTIPRGPYQLNSLEFLDLSSNHLIGTIPNNLLTLKTLKTLLLNNNKLSGKIPPNILLNSSHLLTFNASFNNLTGSFHLHPSMNLSSFKPLSLSISKDSSSSSPVNNNNNNNNFNNNNNNGGFSSIEIASITSASAIVSVLLALVLLYFYTRKCNPNSSNSSSEPSRRFSRASRRKLEVTRFIDIGVEITYESVVRSTGNFNASNCIGSGGFGATYKAEISPGILVAIKRLSVGRFQGIQQFQAEIKTLGSCQHNNLVTLIGYHLGESEMFLIYNYLPGGNLEKFIQERLKNHINWRKLHKIALDIAQALTFLHDNCVPRILHRDVKPSNILLDNEFNAYLSDFGLARLLGNSETHATTGVAGTFGYVAPEYAMTCRVSDKADVYSYGVVLLELISDKKALDPSFSPYGNGFNIVAWAIMLLEKGRAKEFFLEGLWEKAPHDDLVEILHLGVKCTGESLNTRPSMKHVVRRLKELRPPNF